MYNLNKRLIPNVQRIDCGVSAMNTNIPYKYYIVCTIRTMDKTQITLDLDDVSIDGMKTKLRSNSIFEEPIDEDYIFFYSKHNEPVSCTYTTDYFEDLDQVHRSLKCKKDITMEEVFKE